MLLLCAKFPSLHVFPAACDVLAIRQLAESKLAMMEANEEQLRQRQERLAAEKEEENRLVQIMLDKFKVLSHRGLRRVLLLLLFFVGLCACIRCCLAKVLCRCSCQLYYR